MVRLPSWGCISMSMISKLSMLGAAGGSSALDVADVFSVDTYSGSSSAQSINNGVDLAGNGGLVWMKNRTSGTYSHALQDTITASEGYLSSDKDSGIQAAAGNGISSFNSSGFTFNSGNWEEFNNSSHNYVAWTFRVAENFHDIQTWSGNGVNGRQIAHNLGSVPGMIFVKLYKMTNSGSTSSRDWRVYHRSSVASNPENYFLTLNNTNEAYDTTQYSQQNIAWNGTAPTDTHFTVGSNDVVNGNYNNLGWTYVAYIFAHNDAGDDSDIIKCSSYSNAGNGTFVNVGFEPQYLLIKKANAYTPWYVFDSTRGFGATFGTTKFLAPNNKNEELNLYTGITTSSTGFTLNTSETDITGGRVVYMAIRAEGT